MKSKFSAPDTVVDFHTDVHQQKCSDTTIEKYIRKSSRFPRTATMTKRRRASSFPGDDGFVRVGVAVGRWPGACS